MKPKSNLKAANGNIFHIMNMCNTSLRKYPNAYNEMRDRIKPYGKLCDEVWNIIYEYIEEK